MCVCVCVCVCINWTLSCHCMLQSIESIHTSRFGLARQKRKQFPDDHHKMHTL